MGVFNEDDLKSMHLTLANNIFGCCSFVIDLCTQAKCWRVICVIPLMMMSGINCIGQTNCEENPHRKWDGIFNIYIYVDIHITSNLNNFTCTRWTRVLVQECLCVFLFVFSLCVFFFFLLVPFFVFLFFSCWFSHVFFNSLLLQRWGLKHNLRDFALSHTLANLYYNNT